MKVVSTCEKNNQLCSFAVKQLESMLTKIIECAPSYIDAKERIVSFVINLCDIKVFMKLMSKLE